MYYSKENSSVISFPLGGIGSGCIGLAGNGGLCDWEIFNQSSKNSVLAYSHFGIRANGKYRVLQGDCYEPYTGKYHHGDYKKCYGFGFGVEESLLAGLPHFRDFLFNGKFPIAEVTFSGEEEDFPLTAQLVAWSPFIPGMERESSLPCAVFEYTFKNISSETAECSAIGVLGNPWLDEGHCNFLRESGNIMTMSDGKNDELSLMVLESPENISSQEYLYRGSFVDALEMFLVNLKKGGRFAPRTYPRGEKTSRLDNGLLSAHFKLAPYEERRVTFIISWHCPFRSNTWNPNADEEAKKNSVENRWRNYYATQWCDSAASAAELAARIDELRSKTLRFTDILHRCTLDQAIVDGASASLSTLRSPTCLRLEDGTFYGWEGVGTCWGSCEGSCIHVWNYAQAAAFLFPELEHSMNESHLKYSMDDNGAVHFRLHLPLGIKAETDWFRPCADGQFGLIMKFFRDWKLSGDGAWIKRHYHTLKKVISYAWSKDNPDYWDPDKSGVLTGRQHHTLDMELFGLNSWLTGFYLGALEAMAQIAAFCGDETFSIECKTIAAKGREAVKECFNGKYFCQKIDLTDHSVLDRWPDAEQWYWNNECGELKYQIGEGLEIDACLGEFFASFYGIGQVFDQDMTEKTLSAILANNFRSMREHINPWRSYAVNDERGVCICSWVQNKPAIALPYNSEMMNGFEWAFASHLMLCGKTAAAVEVARAIRDRYDGRRRNPWNEFECGSNYARSMAAFGLIPVASGFKFDMNEKMLGFLPKTADMRSSLWSIGRAWGEFRQEEGKFALEVAFGRLQLNKLLLPKRVNKVLLNGSEITVSTAENMVLLPEIELGENDILELF